MTSKNYRDLFRLPFLALFAVAIMVGMTGCETFEGAGQDIENAGEAVSDTADDVQDDL